jgi:alpha-1,3-glucosyltransferase
VGDTAFAVLPAITTRMTFILTLLSQFPPLVKLFLVPTWDNFIGATILCAYSSFLFGWHVHEKAILLVTIPFSMICFRDRRHLVAFEPLAVASQVCLFPLLFEAKEWPIKVGYTALWLGLFKMVSCQIVPVAKTKTLSMMQTLSSIYHVAAVGVVIYTSLGHTALFGEQLEFLPLMITSVYCAAGVVGSWICYLVLYLS